MAEVKPRSALAVAYAATMTLVPPGVKVATRVPNPRPKKLVRISRIGGTRSNPVTDQAVLLFECWASSDIEAEELANHVVDSLPSIRGRWFDGSFIRHWRLTFGPVDHPDESNQARFQFQGELLIKIG
ncbi:hypothetical protein [Rhodococcus sp. 1168]|uniref:hypothetical protein n=1 Tax=Rhodococcus sp. 1168 TaxID=2018041 RepID=UPI000F744877|nr:hypothetical protein [Rhodococcus sp. 1168]